MTVTFNRQLDVPLNLPDGTLLPKGSFLSVPQWPVYYDPTLYKDPETFDAARFAQLPDNDKWTFASHNSDWPGWGTGKFACPGRFWASAQMKLILVTLLNEYDTSLPDGQVGRPKNMVYGESCLPDFTQGMRLKRRGQAAS